MSNQEIIEALKNQNREVERFVYQKHKSNCIRYAIQHFFYKTADEPTIKCKEEDAEELYNDACVLFIQNILNERIPQLETQISTYLITSMRYRWMNKARAMKPKLQKSAIEIPQSTKETIRLNVRKAIDQLDEKCRAMMTYRYILGWEDYADIAKATGKNNGDVVRNLISRCRKRFREHYAEVTKLSGI